MKKDLPSMFKNNIKKNLNNTQILYSSLNKNNQLNENTRAIRTSSLDERFIIEQKIKEIFSSKDYIYKADVTIVTNDNILHKRVIGRVKDNLLTFDNEQIPISIIKDIYK